MFSSLENRRVSSNAGFHASEQRRGAYQYRSVRAFLQDVQPTHSLKQLRSPTTLLCRRVFLSGNKSGLYRQAAQDISDTSREFATLPREWNEDARAAPTQSPPECWSSDSYSRGRRGNSGGAAVAPGFSKDEFFPKAAPRSSPPFPPRPSSWSCFRRS